MKAILTTLIILCSYPVCAQTARQTTRSHTEKEEPILIGEIGGSINRSLQQPETMAGPTLGIEWTPLKERLELEFDINQNFGKAGNELSFDLLFKKPWTLSNKFEFMLGVGPEFSIMKNKITTANTTTTATNTWGAELATDFMYWPFQKKKFGFFVEPNYDYSFSTGNEQSIGIEGGLLVGIR